MNSLFCVLLTDQNFAGYFPEETQNEDFGNLSADLAGLKSPEKESILSTDTAERFSQRKYLKGKQNKYGMRLMEARRSFHEWFGLAMKRIKQRSRLQE